MWYCQKSNKTKQKKKTNINFDKNIIQWGHFKFTEYNEMGWGSEGEIGILEKNYVVYKDCFANKHRNKNRPMWIACYKRL